MTESRNRILRRIILNISEPNEFVPEKIKIEDITKLWDFICEVGPTPFMILSMANNKDESVLSDKMLNEFLNSLNRHWGIINTGKRENCSK